MTTYGVMFRREWPADRLLDYARQVEAHDLDDKIRRKKPWAVATAASLLFGLAMSTAGYSNVASSVSVPKFGDVEKKVDDLKAKKTIFEGKFTTAEGEFKTAKEDGARLVTAIDTREMWLEVYRAINECLPRDTGNEQDIEDITLKNRVNVKSVTAKKYADVGKWVTETKEKPGVYISMLKQDQEAPPTGPGYVFTLAGEHFRHDPNDDTKQLQAFVKNYVLSNFQKFEVQQPGTSQPIPVRKLGITHAVFKSDSPKQFKYFPKGKKSKGAAATKTGGPAGFGQFSARPKSGPTSGSAADGLGKDFEEHRMINQNSFSIQFVWIPTPVEKRLKADPLKPAVVEVTAPLDASNSTATPNPSAPAVAVPNSPAAASPPPAVPGK